MRRLVFIVFIVIASVFCVFATDETYQKHKIYAYKQKQSTEPGSTLPEPSCVLRILDYNNTNVNENGKIEIPQEGRNRQYSVFSWVLGGNVFDKVELSFQFGPMLRYRVSDTTDEGFMCLPYSVEVRHVESRIGNMAISTIPYSGETYTSSYPTESSITGTTYNVYYTDSVSGSGATETVDMSTVNSEGYVEIGLEYHMDYSTVIKNAAGEVIGTAVYGANVCDYWNRIGTVKVSLSINSDGTDPNGSISGKYRDGRYYATVRAIVMAR